MRRAALVALGAALAVALLWIGAAGTAQAQETAGMSLSVTSGGTCSADECVVLGGTFTLAVVADPAPAEEISGFNTEVVFPEGLSWNQRTCEENVKVGLQDETAEFGVCEAFVSSILGGAGHAVLSEFTFPVPPLDVVPGSTTTLVEMEFSCTADGIYALVLTTSPPSAEGSLFSNLEASEIPVATTTTAEIGGETVDVADTLDINCGGVTIDGPQTGTGPASSGNGAGLNLLLVAGSLLAAGAAASAFGWRFARGK